MKQQPHRAAWWRWSIVLTLPLLFFLLQGCATFEKVTGFWQLSEQPADLAWDGAHLWVLDGEQGIIQRVKPNTDKVSKVLKVPLRRPVALAFDGQHFWALDRDEQMIRQFEASAGKTLREIKPAFLESLADEATITGMTFHNGNLWIAVSAGWCSTLQCVDTDTGNEVLSVFPQCDPFGLASDGRSVWAVAYNGTELPSKLSKWALTTDTDRFKESQEINVSLEVKRPGGIVYADGALWIADSATGKIMQIRAQ